MTAPLLFTHTLVSDEVFVISDDDGIQSVSVMCNTGTLTIKGSKTMNNLPSDDITLSAGNAVTISSSNGVGGTIRITMASGSTATLILI